MEQMVAAMANINERSNDISNVIKVIDDLAFQTNILALNAAVEAARAGAHGKGFAVAAGEVRNLASKSSEAAKETADLIAKSFESVTDGSRLVETAKERLIAVEEIEMQNATSIHKIDDAAHRQREAIEQVAVGANQLSAVVQANSATAEETAASSKEMSAQSNLLNAAIEQFVLNKATSRNVEPVWSGPAKIYAVDENRFSVLQSKY